MKVSLSTKILFLSLVFSTFYAQSALNFPGNYVAHANEHWLEHSPYFSFEGDGTVTAILIDGEYRGVYDFSDTYINIFLTKIYTEEGEEAETKQFQFRLNEHGNWYRDIESFDVETRTVRLLTEFINADLTISADDLAGKTVSFETNFTDPTKNWTTQTISFEADGTGKDTFGNDIVWEILSDGSYKITTMDDVHYVAKVIENKQGILRATIKTIEEDRQSFITSFFVIHEDSPEPLPIPSRLQSYWGDFSVSAFPFPLDIYADNDQEFLFRTYYYGFRSGEDDCYNPCFNEIISVAAGNVITDGSISQFIATYDSRRNRLGCDLADSTCVQTGQFSYEVLAINQGRYITNWREYVEVLDREFSFIVILKPVVSFDYDNDGIPDYYEVNEGLDNSDPLDAALDFDDDGLSNYEEYIVRGDPYRANSRERTTDSDNDSIPDYLEARYGFNTGDPTDALLDNDSDGFLNVHEIALGTNPIDNASTPDTDLHNSLPDAFILDGANQTFLLENANDDAHTTHYIGSQKTKINSTLSADVKFHDTYWEISFEPIDVYQVLRHDSCVLTDFSRPYIAPQAQFAINIKKLKTFVFPLKRLEENVYDVMAVGIYEESSEFIKFVDDELQGTCEREADGIAYDGDFGSLSLAPFTSNWQASTGEYAMSFTVPSNPKGRDPVVSRLTLNESEGYDHALQQGFDWISENGQLSLDYGTGEKFVGQVYKGEHLIELYTIVEVDGDMELDFSKLIKINKSYFDHVPWRIENDLTFAYVLNPDGTGYTESRTSEDSLWVRSRAKLFWSLENGLIRIFSAYDKEFNFSENCLLNPDCTAIRDRVFVLHAKHGDTLILENRSRLTNYDWLSEYMIKDRDQDGDGFPDSWEYFYGFDDTQTNDPNKDTDGDGLSDLIELTLGTSPIDTDSDGDGIPDRNDTNPLKSSDIKNGVEANQLIVLSDVNGDGSDEIGYFSLSDFNTKLNFEVSNSDTFDLVSSYQWDNILVSPRIFTLPDLNDDGISEVGFFGLRNDEGHVGKGRLSVIDPTSGDTIKLYSWPASWKNVSLVVIDDINGDGTNEFALQGISLRNNRPQLVVRDGETGTALRTFNAPAQFYTPHYRQMTDFNGDGTADIGFTGIRKNNGNMQTRILDAISPSNRLGTKNFSSKWDAKALHRLSDSNQDNIDDWGLFGVRKQDARPQIVNKSGSTTKGILRIHTWPGDMDEPTFHRIPDMNMDGVDELGVSGLRENGRYQLNIKDGADRSKSVANLGWPNNWRNVSFEVLPDLTNDGVVEFALFGQNATGDWELFVKSGGTKLELCRHNLGHAWSKKPRLLITPETDNKVPRRILVYGIVNGSIHIEKVSAGEDKCPQR